MYNCGIYKIENLVNNKVYIGQSIRLKQRKLQHLSLLNRGVHRNAYLQHSFDVYGVQNF